MNQIDLNCDVGEGIENEAVLMPFISSCNIACGGHAGDAETMRKVIELAAIHNVKIGAHPGYEDKENFGRVVLTLSRKQLKESIQKQIHALRKEVDAQGQRLHHVKPHGALYNKAAVDMDTAEVIVEAIAEMDTSLVVYAPYGSLLSQVVKGILPAKIEGFADRNYNNDYTLVSRSFENAIIDSPKSVMDHVERMVCKHQITTIQGSNIEVQLDTLCVHGDTKTAQAILSYLHKMAPLHQISFS